MKIVLLVGLFFLATGSNPCREELPYSVNTNYSKVFNSNYKDALTYIEVHPEISYEFLLKGISPIFAWAIVFPELIRYNNLKDKLELATLYTLYINFGELYANFSVGNFQMKPSFVRQLEIDYLNQKVKLPNNDNYKFDTCQTRSARAERIKRLDSEQWQAKYLIIFISLMENRHPPETWASGLEKIKFFATAYNCGYNKPKEEIDRFVNQHNFYTSFFIPENKNLFCYSDISADYYMSISAKANECKTKFPF